ncbi:phosphotransferase enzyme family protein [Kutzneria viridogrisea]|uniref:phosphotransferase enzyme family protein n=1 Tax=Kutzneria viridogrisea TaxID=47990 RepID=UPI00296F9258
MLYQLPNRIVARIGRPGTYEIALRELQASRWLATSGFPVVRALDVHQPTLVEDRPVTWWELLPEHRSATPSELGAVLRDLHALPLPAETPLPEHNPLRGLSTSICGASTVSAADRSWLLSHLHDLEKRYRELPEGLPRCVVHGDAWQGNVAVIPQRRPVVLDLDHVAIGRPEWDLIPLAVDRMDFQRISEAEYRAFVTAYGGFDVTTWPGYRPLADICELRWLCFALTKADSNKRAAAEAEHRLSCLRGDIPRPWTWSAF